ncbi:hypothetical protein OG426_54090 [Streptomyces canus]|uniref:hypothetical protein n=1 Tax=Streptomyces canus TaxID=58343 RepID=UPI00224D00AC|nr:hypothetical protein [Streptomyces canus]MCX4853830.1 hypothetical protein [Streptomyces canus]WSW40698.1 hypothetical protein OG426_54090 [Streptomyces canus]
MTILELHTPQAFVDPYAADPAETVWPAAAAGQDMDYLLPPPTPPSASASSSTPATSAAWPCTPR